MKDDDYLSRDEEEDEEEDYRGKIRKEKIRADSSLERGDGRRKPRKRTVVEEDENEPLSGEEHRTERVVYRLERRSQDRGRHRESGREREDRHRPEWGRENRVRRRDEYELEYRVRDDRGRDNRWRGDRRGQMRGRQEWRRDERRMDDRCSGKGGRIIRGSHDSSAGGQRRRLRDESERSNSRHKERRSSKGADRICAEDDEDDRPTKPPVGAQSDEEETSLLCSARANRSGSALAKRRLSDSPHRSDSSPTDSKRRRHRKTSRESKLSGDENENTPVEESTDKVKKSGWDKLDQAPIKASLTTVPQPMQVTPISGQSNAVVNAAASAVLEEDHVVLPVVNASLLAQTQKHLQTQLCRIYVGSLDYSLTEEDIKAIFQAFGQITVIDMPREAGATRSKGFCFVEYNTKEAADMALMSMQGFQLKGRAIRIGRPTVASGMASQAVSSAVLSATLGAAAQLNPQSALVLQAMSAAASIVQASGALQPAAALQTGATLQTGGALQPGVTLQPVVTPQLGAALQTAATLEAGATLAPPVQPFSISSPIIQTPPVAPLELSHLSAGALASPGVANALAAAVAAMPSAPPVTSSAVKTSIFPTVESTSKVKETQHASPPATKSVETSPPASRPATRVSSTTAAIKGNITLPPHVLQAVLENTSPTPGSLVQPPPCSDATAGGGARPRKINVGAVSAQLTDSDLQQIFSVFGSSATCQLVPDDSAGHMGYGTIEFAAPEEAQLAVDTMNGFEVGGQKLVVSLGDIPEKEPSVDGKLASQIIGKTCVVLSNMAEKDDIDEDLEEEIREECSKFGQVSGVKFQVTDTDMVKIFVLFERDSESRGAVEKLNGRWFGGKQVKAEILDS